MHAMRDSIEVGSGSLHVSAGSESAQEMAAHGVCTEGDPEIRAKSVELQGHDADEGGRLAVEDKGCAEDFGISAELLLPEPVIHDEHWWSTRLAIFLRDGADEQR